MRVETLSEKVDRLEREIEALAQETSEEKQQQWRFRRGDLAQAQYELFLELETQRPVLAVQLLYKSATIGNSKAQGRLFKKKPQSESIVKEGEQDKSKFSVELLFVYGLQALAGVGVKPDDSSAFQYFQFAAEKGYWDAQTYLGSMYREGQSVAQDDVEAVAWYRRAAEQGNAAAQTSLGWMYKEGRGVVQDDVQAVAWFRRAAEQRDATAQNNLGWMYENGRGVAQDDAQAVAWYRLAAEQGYACALNNLGGMYKEGRGAAQDEAQAVGWYRRAAEQGNATAQSNLGCMYENNRINPNPDEAIDYRKDYQLGIKPALALLKQCARLSFGAKYHYHLAQSNNSGIREMLEKEPKEFFEVLKRDTLLSQEARADWLERLFGEQHRPINRFELWRTYNKRPKLEPEYLMTLNMEVARNRYAALASSPLPKKANMTEVEEIKGLANKMESQKSKIEELIKILNTITEDHADYPEAQLILSHLHYRLDNMGSQWEQHFTKCEKVDKENKWIGRQIIPNWIHFQKSCVVIQEYLEALLSKDESKIENLLKQELLEMVKDRKAIEPLLRLSIMAKRPEEFDRCVTALKALGLGEKEIEERAQSILSKKSYF